MATSKDFQIIHKRYQEEGLPHGVSIIRFCQQNGIIYKQYMHWLKNRSKVSIHPVSLTNVPVEDVHDEVSETPTNETAEIFTVSENEGNPSRVLFNLRIVTSTGMLLQHRNLDYTKLLNLVRCLEGLC